MPKIRVKSSYEIVTEESSREGDAEERGWLNEEGELFDSADEVIRHLRNKGVMEPSSSCFHKGVWYNTEAQQDMHTGAYESKSYFIHDATIGQERKIYKKLFPEYGDCR
jgi:hypothetical protein